MDDRTDLLQGTLALMILRTLETLGPQHGFGIARRIEQVSDGTLQLNHGTVYPARVRLEQEGWIKAKWVGSGSFFTVSGGVATYVYAPKSDVRIRTGLSAQSWEWHWGVWWHFGQNARRVDIPLWCPALVLGLLAGGVEWRHRRRGRDPGLCRCGYSLAGLPAGGACPECGAETRP